MIIAFNGGMGVGKSTAVEMLRSLSFINGGAPVALVKFAQPLYDMQEFIYSRIDGAYQRPEGFIKDRKLLQWLGTEWGRDSIRKSIWVDTWDAAAKNRVDLGKLVVCDDCRFDNEAEIIKYRGGIIINITSKFAAERIDTGAGIKAHQSEVGIDPGYIDFYVKNDATIEEFKEQIRKIFNKILSNNGAKECGMTAQE